MLPALLIFLVGSVAAAGGLWGAVRWWKRRNATALDRIDLLLLGGEYRTAADASLVALGNLAAADVTLELRCRLARALVGVEEFAAAQRVCEEAAEAAAGPAGRGQALVELARCYAAAGDFDAARRVLGAADALPLERTVRLKRDLTIADIALAQLRFDEAARALTGAFGPGGSGPLADEAAIGHARLQYLRGNFRQAIAEIHRLIATLRGEDNQAHALVILARALLDQERPVPVEADQAISSALVLAHFPGLLAVATACSALVQAHFGNADEALDAAKRAPGMTVSKRFAADANCLAGDALRRLNRYPEARARYQTALGLDADSLEALWGLGKCAQATGLFEVAESYFQLCIEAAPEHFLGQRSEDAIETET